jgi:hypothetical protein
MKAENPRDTAAEKEMWRRIAVALGAVRPKSFNG